MLDLSLGSDIYKNDIWSCAQQELDILFNTSNTELIGHPDFGTTFDDFLWTLTPTTTALNSYIEQKLAQLEFVSKLKHSVNIRYRFDETSYENFYYVTITLYDDYNAVEKTYNITSSNN